MTTTPSGQAAPVPTPPDHLSAAKIEAVPDSAPSVNVLGHEFKLVPKLSVLAAAELDDAQASGSLSHMIRAASYVIHKDDRDAFVEFIRSEPDDGSVITLEDFLDALNSAIEAVIGRPTNT